MLDPDLAGSAAGTGVLLAQPSLHAGPASGPAGPREGQVGQQPAACGSLVARIAAAEQQLKVRQPGVTDNLSDLHKLLTGARSALNAIAIPSAIYLL